MKRILYVLPVIVLLILFYTFILKQGNQFGRPSVLIPDNAEPVYAIFYADSVGGSFEELSLPHFMMRWGRWEPVFSSALFNETVNSGKPVLITLETWEPHFYHRNTHQTLSEIYKGDRDGEFIKLCKSVLKEHPEIILRWAPEMEVPANRFPWQNRPFEYIRAFRHLDSLLGIHSPETKLVWGPSGYPGVLEFWPGSEHADMVSITLGSLSDSLTGAYPNYHSLPEELKRKMHRIRFTDKPVLILSRKREISPEEFEKIIQLREQSADIYTGLNNDPVINSHKRQEIKIGLYDPDTLLTDNPSVDIEHIFIDFDKITDGTYSSAFENAARRGHDLIVTMEPMFLSREEKDRAILDKILQGDYDSIFNRLFDGLRSFQGQVYLRFAHEMEIPIERYPWQSQDPLNYINAFRYFMSMARDKVPGVVCIWGPAGDRGSLEFWPGDQYVDMISIAIYGLPDKNITDPAMQESFETIYNRKYRRMRFVDKPVFITEFGVKGPESYQNVWLTNAAAVIRSHPEIFGINYFNMVDTPDVWGKGIKPPDWSISEASFNSFIMAIGDSENNR